MIRTLQQVMKFAGNCKKQLKHSLLLNFLKGCFNILQILAIIVLLRSIANGIDIKTSIISLVIIMLICIIGSYITAFNEQMQALAGNFNMVVDKRMNIAERLKSMPLGFFKGGKSDQINATLTSTLAQVETAAAFALTGAVGGFIGTIAVLCMLFVYEWHFAIIALLGMIAYFYMITLQLNVSLKNSQIQRSAIDNLVAASVSFVQGIKVTKAFSYKDGDQAVKRAIEESGEAEDKLTNLTMPSQYAGNIVIAVSEMVLLVTDLLLYTKLQIIGGEQAIILLLMCYTAYAAMKQSGVQLSMLGILERAMNEVNELEEQPILTMVTPEQSPTSCEIVLNHVGFSYGKHEVLHDISTTIKEGSFTTVIGPSGSGKTTLCHLIARFWDVDQGSITIGGVDIKNMDDVKLNKMISMVFQRVYLFEDTIENNIRIGKDNATHSEIVAAAKAAGCHDFIEKLPNGYKTLLAEGGGSLSGGEKQRISIARAILKDAPIVILDEATSALDVENEQLIMKAIGELTKGKTVIMIAHKMQTVRDADCIIAIENGKIVQEGNHNQLINESGIYKRFVEKRKMADGWTMAADGSCFTGDV